MKINKVCCLLFIVFNLCSANSILAKEALQKLIVAADERYFKIFVPEEYNQDKSYPLVLNFHGTSSDPFSQEALTEFEKSAQKEQFIVASPLALFTRKKGGPITWNVDYELGPDDVLFASNLIEHISNVYNIDASRVYAAGFSGGARMSSRLACDIPQKIAAIAPVAGLRFPDNCQPNQAIPVISFHGEKDTINHYILQKNSPVYWKMGIPESLDKWVKNNHCKQFDIDIYSETVEKHRYTGCDAGADILFYKSSIAGHTWPGSSQADKFVKFGLGITEKKLNATNLIWKFFTEHPKPKQR
ncbi:alpha/beta hydrolase family esterase [Paraglaciecola sp. 2405UD69-4]|uniref:alpha/beta hydrolase family esterase n=1 Tax=Paraglaciecola sp. 2405UD69-4 TaxID=3391836 RepID=UPI0039C9F272